MSPDHDITRWLHQMTEGDPTALDRVVSLLYDELRSLARHRLLSENAGHTLGATAIVNEVYLKLSRQHRIQATDRAQFFAIAATTMRRVLVDHARAKRRLKRGGGESNLPLEAVEPFLTEEDASEILALDRALTKLAEFNPRGAEIVQQRFYAGLSLKETADLMGVSVKTVQRDWIAARAWLRKEVAVDLGF